MKCNIRWMYWFVGIIVFCIDRITKNNALALFMTRVESGLPGLSYEMTFNRGVTGGLLHFSHDGMFAVVSLMIICITMLVAWYAYKDYKQGASIIGHVFIIAGSLSNIVDRIFYHGVIDFIVVSFHGYSWPVFNVADMAIVGGVCIVAWQQVYKVDA